MHPGDGGLRRPLAQLAMESELLGMDELIAASEGVLNLLSKADRAVEAGTPADRTRALALVHRAEQRLTAQDLDAAGVPPEFRRRFEELRDLALQYRRRAEALAD